MFSQAFWEKFRLACITLPFLGTNFAWSAEFATVTPYLHSVGLPTDLKSAIWIAGPITGLVIGPVSGVLSDHCQSRWGRRRPFVLGGLILLLLAQMLFAFSKPLGAMMASTEIEEGGQYSSADFTALTLGIIAFWLMDVMLNIMQTPLRAAAADLCNSRQELAQAMVSFWTGLGNILSYGFAAAFDPIHDLTVYFMTAAAMVTVTCSIMLVAAKETPYVNMARRDESGCTKIVSVFASIVKSVRNMPSAMYRVCLVQVLTWLVFFCFIPFVTSYMGIAVYGGDDSPCHYDDITQCTEAQQLYTHGVSAGGLAMMLQAVVQLIFAFTAPILSARFGLKRVFFASYVLMIGLFFAMSGVGDRVAATVFIALTGIPWGACNIFPFAIVGLLFEPAQLGMMMGALNVFIVLPQLVDTAYVGAIGAWSWFAVMFVGGVWSIFAAISVLFLKVPTADPTFESFADDEPSESHEL